MQKAWIVFILTGLIGIGTLPVLAFDLSPKGTRLDRKIVKEWAPSWLDGILSSLAEKGLPKFKQSVHEEIAHRSYGCHFEGESMCGDPDAEFASPYVIAGVRWNDDPPFQLNKGQASKTSCKTRKNDGSPITIRFITQPKCWGELYLAAEKQLSANPNTTFNAENHSAMHLRSHLGDLQFLHSMASNNNEGPENTRDLILGWAEFTWGVVSGDYKLDTWLKDIKLPVIEKYFGASDWRVQELFTLGDPSLRSHLEDVAFGSLLHMVGDSFAAGHIERMEPTDGTKCSESSRLAPGPIREFHAYPGQTASLHAEADKRTAFINRPTPDAVDVGKVLVELRKAKAPWSEVSAYLSCVYAFAPDVRKSSPGDF